jgi:hypothetical protein
MLAQYFAHFVRINGLKYFFFNLSLSHANIFYITCDTIFEIENFKIAIIFYSYTVKYDKIFFIFILALKSHGMLSFLDKVIISLIIAYNPPHHFLAFI